MRSLLPPHSARPSSHPLRERVRQGLRRRRAWGCCQQWVTHSGSIKWLRAGPAAGDQDCEASWSSLRLVPDQKGGFHRGSRKAQTLARLNHGLLHLDLPSGRGCGPDRSCHILTAQIHEKERHRLSPMPAEKMPGQASDRPSQVTCPLWPGHGRHGWRDHLEKERDIHHQEAEGGSRQTTQQMAPPVGQPSTGNWAQPWAVNSGRAERAGGECAPLPCSPRAARSSSPPLPGALDCPTPSSHPQIQAEKTAPIWDMPFLCNRQITRHKPKP